MKDAFRSSGTLDVIGCQLRAVSGFALATLAAACGGDPDGAGSPTSTSSEGVSGLVAEWKLDEPVASTSFANSSGTGDAGTCAGTACPTLGVAGKVGTAASFSSGQTISFGNPANLDFGTGSFTYSLWIYTSSTPSSEIVWYKGGRSVGDVGYDLEQTPGKGWSANVTDGAHKVRASTGSAGLIYNQWCLLTAVVDRGAKALSLYRNGKFVSSSNISGIGSLSSSTPARLSSNGAGGHFFSGRIDDVRLYSRALSASEVAGLYTGTSDTGTSDSGIAWRSTSTAVLHNATSTKLSAPAGTQVGDVLVAALGVGDSGNASQPTLTAPTGWTLVRRTNHGTVGTLAVYTHPFASGEGSYTWTSSSVVSGTAWISAYTGASTTSPVDVEAGQDVVNGGTSISTPSITTTANNEMLVANFVGYTNVAGAWSAVPAMIQRANLNNGDSRSGSSADAIQTTAGSSGAKTSTASVSQAYAITHLLALRPSGSIGGGAVCGNQSCESGETCGSCPADCGTCSSGDEGLSCVTTGTQYYVSPSGSDANSGSSPSPWKTISHAVATAGPGSTVHVASGTYNEQVQGDTSGSSASRICFISDTKWGAKLVGTASGNSGAWELTASYVDIQDFDISNPSGTLGVFVNGSNVRVIGNHIHNVPASACDSNGGAGIIFYQGGGSGNDAIGNWVHDVGILNNLCWRVHGIYLAAPGGRVWNNIVYRTVGWGIHLWHLASNATISGNTVFNNNYGGILIGAGDCNDACVADYTTVSNNVVYKNGLASGAQGYGIEEYGYTGTHNKYLNNLVYQNGPANWNLKNGITASATVTADPLFISYTGDGSGNYRLQSTSPAIDAGTDVGAPAFDIEGIARPQPAGGTYDIGAYEYH